MSKEHMHMVSQKATEDTARVFDVLDGMLTGSPLSGFVEFLSLCASEDAHGALAACLTILGTAVGDLSEARDIPPTEVIAGLRKSIAAGMNTVETEINDRLDRG